MNVHENARMTAAWSILLVGRVREAGWRVADAALRPGCRSARPTPGWRAIGRAASRRCMTAARRPPDAPRRLPREVDRRDRAAAPAALERPAHRARSRPAGRDRRLVLRRLGLGRLAPSSPSRRRSATSAAPPASCSTSTPRSSAGSTASATASPAIGAATGARGIGWEHLHVAIDDASPPRLHRAAARRARPRPARLPARAAAWFAGQGVPDRAGHDRQRLRPIARSQTSAGSPSSARGTSPPDPTRRAPTARPSASSRPALREWLYAKPYPSSASAPRMPGWLHWYNHHRPHAGIHASTPASRLNNLLGNDS